MLARGSWHAGCLKLKPGLWRGSRPWRACRLHFHFASIPFGKHSVPRCCRRAWHVLWFILFAVPFSVSRSRIFSQDVYSGLFPPSVFCFSSFLFPFFVLVFLFLLHFLCYSNFYCFFYFEYMHSTSTIAWLHKGVYFSPEMPPCLGNLGLFILCPKRAISNCCMCPSRSRALRTR